VERRWAIIGALKVHFGGWEARDDDTHRPVTVPERIFVAGATGVLGVRLIPLLLEAGHEVAGLTRSPEKAALLRQLGARPVVCDVYDVETLTEAMREFGPDAVIDELTDLPDASADLSSYRSRNNRIRTEGTRNLLAATRSAGANRMITQSIAWEHPNEEARAAVAEHERLVLDAGGVVIRYGLLYGPDTYYPTSPPSPPRIHVDEAAGRTVPALEAPSGIMVLVEDGEA